MKNILIIDETDEPAVQPVMPEPPAPAPVPVQPAVAEAPAVSISSNPEDFPQSVSVKVTINIAGTEHIFELPQVSSAAVETAVAPPTAPPAAPPVAAPSASGTANLITYRVQVGAFSNPVFAQDAFDRLRRAGFVPSFERHGSLYRVVISGVRAADISQVEQRLEAAGFSNPWIREER